MTETVEKDPIDPFIRSLIGYRADPEERLLIHILEAGVPVPLSSLTPKEEKLAKKFVESEWAKIDSKSRIELAPLGKSITRGAKKTLPRPLTIANSTIRTYGYDIQ